MKHTHLEDDLGGTKHDKEKARWDLLPFAQVEEIVDVLTYGAEKYDDNNWQKISKDRYVAAMFRHLSEYMCGQENDKDSGLSTLAHAGCCLLFIMWHDLHVGNVKKVLDQVWERKKVDCHKPDFGFDYPIKVDIKRNQRDEMLSRLMFNLARRADGWDSPNCCIFCQCLKCSSGCEGYARQEYLLHGRTEEEWKDRPEIDAVVERWERHHVGAPDKSGAPCSVPLGFLRNLRAYILHLGGKV